MGTIEAIYEDGVFRPVNPVVLPEKSRVQLQIIEEPPAMSDEGMDAIYEIMERRFNSGFTDTAECHNEHQP